MRLRQRQTLSRRMNAHSSNESPSDRPKLVPIWPCHRTVKATLVAMAVHR